MTYFRLAQAQLLALCLVCGASQLQAAEAASQAIVGSWLFNAALDGSDAEGGLVRVRGVHRQQLSGGD